jgi:hypothetical protein
MRFSAASEDAGGTPGLADLCCIMHLLEGRNPATVILPDPAIVPSPFGADAPKMRPSFGRMKDEG